jgi:hypothetical protein
MEALGGALCVRCEFKDVRALQIDHVHGNGAEMRRTPGGRGVTLYNAIIKGRVDRAHFQVLCANCQWIKKDEEEEVKGNRIYERTRRASDVPEPDDPDEGSISD